MVLIPAVVDKCRGHLSPMTGKQVEVVAAGGFFILFFYFL
jgi:NAD(P)H-dependent flavin oxidoreductase YrpB (nitropropane dioxygenase family)